MAPVFYLAENSAPEVFHVSIKAGADLNATYRGEGTPLFRVASNGKNPEIITVLTKAGAKVNVTNCFDETPLAALSKQSKPL